MKSPACLTDFDLLEALDAQACLESSEPPYRDPPPSHLSDCPQCSNRGRSLFAAVHAIAHPDPLTALEYDEAALLVWPQYKDLPFADQLDAIRTNSDLPTWGLTVYLLELAQEQRSENLQQHHQFVMLALEVTEHLSDHYDPALLAGLKAFAYASHANAFRLRADSYGGHQASRAARTQLTSARMPPYRHAETLSLLISHHLATRDFAVAEELFAAAFALPPSGRTTALLQQKALFYALLDQPMEAVQVYDRLLEIPNLSPFLGFSVAISAAATYAETGNAARAANYLDLADRQLSILRTPSPDRTPLPRAHLAHYDWVRAMVFEAQGLNTWADPLYRRAADTFSELGHWLEAALCSLYLARLSLESGRIDEVSTFLRPAQIVLSQMGAGRELAVVELLLNTTEREAATALLRGLIKTVRARQGANRI